MKILVLNCGSSSIKYKLFDMTTKEVMAQGGIEKIGLAGSFLKFTLPNGEKKILEKISSKSYVIAMCVEGKQLSSEELAAAIDSATMEHSDICFIIGSSHGLAPEVKSACHMRLSVSKLTFPHQLMRVILAEAVYRAFTIIKGTKYHK